ncbi:C45 family autoproteolytic acyltransferase/hydolase [Alkalibacillus salilacus]|uniref:Choloylglycine hydrolase n=1 Tax=Alkalibacillus salilacus TaxID=284582 RepID=A0ABT9VEV4_9BACI|nr:C45 family peptidase [Alkalibacillus salilacus]MDQ0159437.1 putative choloylglycine hydrolase [Alkalibacillus salilacus]
MKPIESQIVQYRGSHYHFGFEQGKALKDSKIIHNRLKHWKIRRPRFQIDIDETKEQFMRFAPQIWDELLGLRDGLEMPLEEVLRDFGGYRVEINRSGCSILTEQDYMIRNYDYHPQTYEGRFNLFQPNDGGYATIGPTSRLTGRMDGMNEHGLVMAYNFTHRKTPEAGFVCYMIGRMILETCRNVEEAKQLLQSLPHRNAFSYILLDPNGETYIVEASPRGVAIRTANVCTNHFEKLTDENRHYLGDSYEREEAINHQRYPNMSADVAFQLMNDRGGSIFADNYKSWSGTIHTSAYFPKEREVWFALGGDAEPTRFNFGDWLNGEDLNRDKMYGEVETELPFAHMD